jgi:mannosylglycoprotein endo-beta-mannosidase
LTRDPFLRVADGMEVGDANIVWNLQFTRSPNDWELSEFMSFFGTIYAHVIRRGGSDKVVWLGSKDGRFTVKSFYTSLRGDTSSSIPWRDVWRSKVPMRVAFFVWEVMHGKILTIDNLRRRGICVIDWCYLCKGDAESIDHLLLHCSVASELWNFVLSLTQLTWVMPASVVGVLQSWKKKFKDPLAKAIWKMIPSCLWWCLWRERNTRCFQNCANSSAHLQDNFLFSLYCWVNAVLGQSFVDYFDFVSFFICMF